MKFPTPVVFRYDFITISKPTLVDSTVIPPTRCKIVKVWRNYICCVVASVYLFIFISGPRLSIYVCCGGGYCIQIVDLISERPVMSKFSSSDERKRGAEKQNKKTNKKQKKTWSLSWKSFKTFFGLFSVSSSSFRSRTIGNWRHARQPRYSKLGRRAFYGP